VTTRTRDPNVSVTVEVLIGYDDKNGNAATASNINAYQVELRDWVRRYFSTKTAADLAPENELRLKNEIRERLNTEVLDTTKARQIMFTRFDVMEL
jgi:flagellar FliL protein